MDPSTISVSDRGGLDGESSAAQIKRKLTQITYEPIAKRTRLAQKTRIDNLQLPTGATSGYVLTSDAEGYATWQSNGSGALLSSNNTWTGTNTFENDVSIVSPATFQGADADFFTGVTSNIQEQINDVIAGIEADNWKQNCYVATIVNHPTFPILTTIQGLTPPTGSRILVCTQNTTSQNGIYIYNGSGVAATRAPDANTAAELEYAKVALSSNDPTMPGYIWYESLAIATLDTSPVTFINISTGVSLDSIAPINLGTVPSNNLPIKMGSGAGAHASANDIYIGNNAGASNTDILNISNLVIGNGSVIQKGTSTGVNIRLGGNSSTIMQGYSIGIGDSISSVGTQAIAIGSGASAFGNSAIGIGRNSDAFGDNSIVINATGSSLSTATNGSCIVAPIRQTAGTTPFNLSYDTTNKEIIYSTSANYLALANIGSSPNAQGASISGTTLTLQPASQSFGGVLTTGSQPIGGLKSFKDNIEVGNPGSTTGLVIFYGSASGNINFGVRSTAGSYTFTLPDNSGTTGYFLRASSFTPGSTEWAPAIAATAIGSTPNANGYDYTPSSGALVLQPASSSFGGILTSGSQPIGGIKTFSDTTQSTSSTTGSLIVSGGLGLAKDLFTAGKVDAATGVNIATGQTYKINNTQISTTALSDTTAKATSTSNTSGAVSTSLTVTYTKIQNVVTIQYPDITVAASSNATLTWQLPTLSPSIFPTMTTVFVARTFDGASAYASGYHTISTGGLITWSRTLQGQTFASGTTYTIAAAAVSYIV